MDLSTMQTIMAAAGDSAAAAVFEDRAGTIDPALVERAAQGILGLEGIKQEFLDQAVRNLRDWTTNDRFMVYRPLLRAMMTAERWDFLLDSFYQTIPFGTGGRRGPVGVGTNRINPYTIATSVLGHVLYLKDRFPDRAATPGGLQVVVAFDVRVFNDSAGRYDPKAFNPLLQITSRDLARVAALVYAAEGVTVHIQPVDAADYISTPELSFFIRKLKAQGGLNVSASHNHPDDNGGKFYNAHGGQEIPPDDELMARMVQKVTDVRLLGFDDAVSEGLVRFIDPALGRAYVDLNLSLSVAPGSRGTRVAYTPLNGTGKNTVGRVLAEAGFHVDLVAAQSDYDGNFPNVPFRIPNPEVPDSMDMARDLAVESGADLVLSTDPDADRLGALTPLPDGTWKFLTGNEIAALLTRFILDARQAAGMLKPSQVLIKTEVTSELISAMATSYGVQCVGHLLVGFKYIGELIRQMEEEGRCGELDAAYEDFLLGGEESHGLLMTPAIRDKDAAGGALLLAELVATLKEKGSSLYDYLLGIYADFGCYANALVPLVMQGARGVANIARIQDAFRADPPKEICGIAVQRFTDHWDEGGVFGPIRSGTDRSSRNVLIFRLEDGSRIAMRPSGTEPKTKIYVEVHSAPMPGVGRDAVLAELERVQAHAQELADDLTDKALAVIGERLSAYALRVSGLVSVDNKKHFAEAFVPELETKAAAVVAGDLDAEALDEWVDESLKPYGKDPRGLVADGMALYLGEQRKAAGADRERLAILESMARLF